MKKRRFPVRLCCFLAWTCVIFLHSSMPAVVSEQESGWVWELLSRLLPFAVSAHQVRKAAHFTEFAILGLLSEPLPRLIPQLLEDGPVSVPRRVTALWLSLSVCVTTALCDETIQLFVEGRSGQVRDVWLDTAGAAFGIALSLLARRVTSRRAAA